uniref:TPX2 C-terminal domain-containing protein n=1 Tax=Compsopogon caeruleus TaxID=31354 RepID=A0A7S1THR0_9RHOD
MTMESVVLDEGVLGGESLDDSADASEGFGKSGVELVSFGSSPQTVTPSRWTGRTVPRSPRLRTDERGRRFRAGDGRPDASLLGEGGEIKADRDVEGGIQKRVPRWTGKTVPITPRVLADRRRTRDGRAQAEGSLEQWTSGSREKDHAQPKWTGRTVPLTPHLHTDRRLRAEQKPSGEFTEQELEKARPAWSGRTVPISPVLMTTARATASSHRTSQFKSFDIREQEELELERLRMAQERKENLDHLERVRQSESRIRSPEPKALTVPQSPTLRTSSRASVRRLTDVNLPSDSPPIFRARPINRAILEHQEKIPQVERKPLTVPKSPDFLTDQRAAIRGEVSPTGSLVEQTGAVVHWTGKTRPRSPPLSYKAHQSRTETSHSEKQETFRARPLPDFHRIFEQTSIRSPTSRKSTQPKPFKLSEGNYVSRMDSSFHNTSPERFRAAPMPFFEEPLSDVKSHGRRATSPVPFHLRSVERHVISQESFQARMENEEKKDAEKRRFSALPLPDFDQIRFSPVKNDTSFRTIPENFSLASEKRAVERARFDEEQRKREQRMDEDRRRAEIEQAQREAEEMKLYRKALEFRARPMPDFSFSR